MVFYASIPASTARHLTIGAHEISSPWPLPLPASHIKHDRTGPFGPAAGGPVLLQDPDPGAGLCRDLCRAAGGGDPGGGAHRAGGTDGGVHGADRAVRRGGVLDQCADHPCERLLPDAGHGTPGQFPRRPAADRYRPGAAGVGGHGLAGDAEATVPRPRKPSAPFLPAVRIYRRNWY